MITTGVVALDDRLGGLRPGALYCFFGASAAGKSVLGLHFLLEGLARGESCVLVTRDEPAMIDSRAHYVGYTVGRLTEHAHLRVLRMPPRLNGISASPGAAFAHWFEEHLQGITPSRIVFDAVDALSDYSDTPAVLLGEVADQLRATGAVSFVLARADREATMDPARYEALLSKAAGAFRLQVSERGERRFVFHAAPPGAFKTEPFAYSLRIGGGFTEDLALGAPDLDPEDRRRVIVLDEIGALSPEVISGLRALFDVELLRSTAGALGRLSAGRYGALVLVVDPFDEGRAFDLVYALRKEGNAAPIVFAAPSTGLRNTTRSRGLRTGGDDFFVIDLPAAEVVERVQMAWVRGSHSRSGLTQIGHIVQPANAEGLPRPMTDSEFRQAVDTLLAEQPPLFFCYLEFSLREGMPEMVWPALRTRVRLADGDIIGVLSNRRFGCVLDRITQDQTWRVVDRIRSAHPMLATMNDVVVIPNPMHADDLRERMAKVVPTPLQSEAVAGA